jgi:hypothetical protein
MDPTNVSLVAQILLTLATIGYGFATMKADFNATHATNPLWTGLARFHLVWQLLSYAGIAAIALVLIWWPGPMAVERLYLAGALAAAIYGAFFITAIARPIFAGELFDENGYLPFKPPVGSANRRWDVNITVFTALSTILIVGILTI